MVFRVPSRSAERSASRGCPGLLLGLLLGGLGIGIFVVVGARAAGGLALLLGLDAVGLALLERLALLVEVGAEVVDGLGDRLAERVLVVVLELAALVHLVQ